MAVLLRQVEKFLDDHPQFADQRQEILNQARGMSWHDAVTAAGVEELFGKDLARILFTEATTNPEYLGLAREDS